MYFLHEVHQKIYYVEVVSHGHIDLRSRSKGFDETPYLYMTKNIVFKIQPLKHTISYSENR